MDTPHNFSVGLTEIDSRTVDRQAVDTLGPVIQIAKSGFFYCRRGSLALVLDNHAYDIHRGDIFIYPTYSRIYIRSRSEDLLGVIGVADFDFVLSLANTIANTQNHLYIRENPCVSLDEGQQQRVEELIDLIRRRKMADTAATSEQCRLIHTQLLTSLGMALCYEIAEVYFHNHPIQPLKQDRRDIIFQRFIFSLSQHCCLHHDVAFYAAEQCLTPRYFSTIIREKSGRNALQWITTFVLFKAKKLLADPDLSVKEIAEQLGFSNQSFFGRYFKQYVGISPLAYRATVPEKSTLHHHP